jgi:broad specificity phosphatase PhoE
MLRGVQSPLNAHASRRFETLLSTLHLIRHGQASFGTEDYDRLSRLGEQQIGHLRDHYARTGQRLDAIHSGTLKRQRATAAILALPSVDAVKDHSAFDEYDAHALFQAHAKLTGSPLIALQGSGPPDARAFQRRLEEVGRQWIAGALDGPGIERWHDFRSRVVDGLERVMRDSGRSTDVAICTSAGTIGAAVAHVLGLGDEASLRLSWTVFNASITRIRFDASRRTLEVFNAVPHLEAQADPRGLITFR